jgi:hypothetical protein
MRDMTAMARRGKASSVRCCAHIAILSGHPPRLVDDAFGGSPRAELAMTMSHVSASLECLFELAEPRGIRVRGQAAAHARAAAG